MQVEGSVNKSIFYQKLIRALLSQSFKLQSGDFSQDGLSTERDELLSTIRTTAELIVPNFTLFLIARPFSGAWIKCAPGRQWFASNMFLVSPG